MTSNISLDEEQDQVKKSDECYNCKKLELQRNSLSMDVAQIKSKIEFMESKYTSISEEIDIKFTSLNDNFVSLSSEIKKLANNIDQSKTLPLSDVFKKKLTSDQINNINNQKHTNSNTKTNTKTTNNRRNQSTPIFDWKKCLVIGDMKKVLELNPDKIRIFICHQFGATDIDIIKKYINTTLMNQTNANL